MKKTNIPENTHHFISKKDYSSIKTKILKPGFSIAKKNTLPPAIKNPTIKDYSSIKTGILKPGFSKIKKDSEISHSKKSYSLIKTGILKPGFSQTTSELTTSTNNKDKSGDIISSLDTNKLQTNLAGIDTSNISLFKNTGLSFTPVQLQKNIFNINFVISPIKNHSPDINSVDSYVKVKSVCITNFDDVDFLNIIKNLGSSKLSESKGKNIGKKITEDDAVSEREVHPSIISKNSIVTHINESHTHINESLIKQRYNDIDVISIIQDLNSNELLQGKLREIIDAPNEVYPDIISKSSIVSINTHINESNYDASIMGGTNNYDNYNN